MNSNSPEPRFPRPPQPLDGGDEPAIRKFLVATELWRNTVLERFWKLNQDHSVAALRDLTPRARQALALLLAAEWPAGMTGYAAQSPYSIAPFPTAALRPDGQNGVERVKEILHWRGAVVDYLSDVWDVVGKPHLDMEECSAIGRLFEPESGEELCPFCLSVVLPGRELSESHDCPVIPPIRSKWPSPFPEAR